ncbi:trypsin-like peptidase domain-containing protein [Tolypothrix sp. FACHB-123]|uniref:S1 family peptidase n=1 Tax=Tolypothrix sp. FACHB-123 TaxID=2692868 RepID=UPI001688F919|nr:serine protease [Tolypothrix sp. FACHB-123]MBD2355602.1 trypsin-like peptidase domain-containing protein [Tolypothrix sp. FACHB-123]
MDWRLLSMLACIGGLSILLPVSVPISPRVAQPQQFSQGSTKTLQHIAESITVKVWAKGFLGSGILIKEKDSVYTVVTNTHVMISGEPPYTIQAPDGRVFAAKLPPQVKKLNSSCFHDKDLATLQFYSPNHRYAVADLDSASDLSMGNRVFAAGFPFNVEGTQDLGFVFTAGKISWVLDKALEGGYRIGYTNDIQKGMSGGPLLNQQGKVVAINGLHAEPLWGEPYTYHDGTQPEAPLKKRMSKYSWGIPIETVICPTS